MHWSIRLAPHGYVLTGMAGAAIQPSGSSSTASSSGNRVLAEPLMLQFQCLPNDMHRFSGLRVFVHSYSLAITAVHLIKYMRVCSRANCAIIALWSQGPVHDTGNAFTQSIHKSVVHINHIRAILNHEHCLCGRGRSPKICHCCWHANGTFSHKS